MATCSSIQTIRPSTTNELSPSRVSARHDVKVSDGRSWWLPPGVSWHSYGGARSRCGILNVKVYTKCCLNWNYRENTAGTLCRVGVLMQSKQAIVTWQDRAESTWCLSKLDIQKRLLIRFSNSLIITSHPLSLHKTLYMLAMQLFNAPRTPRFNVSGRLAVQNVHVAPPLTRRAASSTSHRLSVIPASASRRLVGKLGMAVRLSFNSLYIELLMVAKRPRCHRRRLCDRQRSAAEAVLLPQHAYDND